MDNSHFYGDGFSWNRPQQVTKLNPGDGFSWNRHHKNWNLSVRNNFRKVHTNRVSRIAGIEFHPLSGDGSRRNRPRFCLISSGWGRFLLEPSPQKTGNLSVRNNFRKVHANRFSRFYRDWASSPSGDGSRRNRPRFCLISSGWGRFLLEPSPQKTGILA